MTDDELKALVASLAEDTKAFKKAIWASLQEVAERQKKTDELHKELAEQQKRTEVQLAEQQKRTEVQLAEPQKRTDEELVELQKKTEAQIAKTEAQLEKTSQRIDRLGELMGNTDELHKELAEQQKKTEVQIAKTEAQLEKTSQRIDRLGELVGNISNNQGDIAEEFFYQSFLQNPVLGGVHFDWVSRQLKNRIGSLQDEYDIVLINGNTIAVIEVKTKAHETDLEKLVQKKLPNFPKLFTTYKDYHYYAGVASLVSNESLVEKAKELGLFLLVQQGNHAEVVQAGRLLQ